jgi:hypothetical protein
MVEMVEMPVHLFRLMEKPKLSQQQALPLAQIRPAMVAMVAMVLLVMMRTATITVAPVVAPVVTVAVAARGFIQQLAS